MSDSSLESRVVIVAGAAGGLGSVATSTFAKAGARLALLGRDRSKLDELAADLKLPADRALTIGVNLGEPANVEKAAGAILKKFGRIDVLLNFVGGWIGGKGVFDTKKEDFDSMLDQHFHATYAMIKAFVPAMQKNGWGRVLSVSSPNATRPPGNNAPYAVGKSAMEALILSLAQELKGTGVTANLLLVRTIDVGHERQNKPSEKNQSWTSPEEISATLLHLCSEEAGMINGARIPLYGEPY
jgi:NAD(P)-dependent dehydrogenase (short-subunit alcohol dehydrogenase family)